MCIGLFLVCTATVNPPLGVATLDSDFSRVLPGQGVGKVTLGSELALVSFLAESKGKTEAGKVWKVFPNLGSHELDVFTVKASHLTDPRLRNLVREIRVTSPIFHTDQGLRVGSSLKTVQSKVPSLKLAKESRAMRLFDDQKSGIAFEFAKKHSEWKCVSIVVHRKMFSVLEACRPSCTIS